MIEATLQKVAMPAENPMLKFGACPAAGKICDECKHLFGNDGGKPEPRCELRGRKAHNPKWAACAKFITWKDWKKSQGEKSPAASERSGTIGYFGEGETL